MLGKNKNWGSIKLLTPSGVVLVKLNKGQFSFYDRTISIPDEETNKNKVVDASWFKKGTILFVHGIRSGDIFRTKTYNNSLYSHSLYRVEKIYEDGIALCQEERYKID